MANVAIPWAAFCEGVDGRLWGALCNHVKHPRGFYVEFPVVHETLIFYPHDAQQGPGARNRSS